MEARNRNTPVADARPAGKHHAPCRYLSITMFTELALLSVRLEAIGPCGSSIRRICGGREPWPHADSVPSIGRPSRIIGACKARARRALLCGRSSHLSIANRRCVSASPRSMRTASLPAMSPRCSSLPSCVPLFPARRSHGIRRQAPGSPLLAQLPCLVAIGPGGSAIRRRLGSGSAGGGAARGGVASPSTRTDSRTARANNASLPTPKRALSASRSRLVAGDSANHTAIRPFYMPPIMMWFVVEGRCDGVGDGCRAAESVYCPARSLSAILQAILLAASPKIHPALSERSTNAVTLT